MLKDNLLLKTVAILGASAVVLGAMGAHMRSILQSDSWTTAVQYQFLHTLALLGIAIFTYRQKMEWPAKISAGLFIIGILLFSGSIYIMGLRQIYSIEIGAFVGKLTPVGGLCMVAAWLSLLFWKK